MNAFSGLLYTKEHLWIKKDGEKAYIGITDFSQNSMGTITHVGLPSVGSSFSTGDSFVVIESVKASNDVSIPVDGKVAEVNNDVSDNPSLLNEDPFKNWLISIENFNDSQFAKLMDAEAYERYCTEEK